MNAKEEKKKRDEFDRLRYELNELDKNRTHEKNEKLIGTCYKFHNSYGHDEKWWLYLQVIGANDYWPIAFQFEKTSMNEFKVETNRIFTGSEGYQKITKEEFREAWVKFRDELVLVSPVS